MIERRQCEAEDIVPTEDDAEYVRCKNVGVVITEHNEFGHLRRRSVCVEHGLELWLAIKEE